MTPLGKEVLYAMSILRRRERKALRQRNMKSFSPLIYQKLKKLIQSAPALPLKSAH